MFCLMEFRFSLRLRDGGLFVSPWPSGGRKTVFFLYRTKIITDININ